MSLIRKIFYILVIVCSFFGLYFSIIGWMRFYEQRILFFIAIYSCAMGFLIGFFEIVGIPRNKYTNFYKIILGFLGGIALILGSLYLTFMSNIPFLIKLISIFGILFFSIGIIKGIKRINIEQEKEIIVNLDYDRAFEKAKEVLIAIKSKIINYNKEEGTIIAVVGFSWKSFGEILTVELRKGNDRQTKIKISSRPKIQTTMLDFGKNFENVGNFINIIKS